MKFRCSSLGDIMTDPKKKTETISETAKKYCIEMYVQNNYGRREEITSKYLDKGNQREEDAITLFSRLTKKFYKKNSERLENEFITGEPDLYLGPSINEALETIDTKCSWSAKTFFNAMYGTDNSDYYWQGMGYMALTGAKKHTVAYCLINGTETAIIDEKRKLSWKLGEINTDNPSQEYRDKAIQIEINHIFSMEEFIAEYPHFDFDMQVDNWKLDIPMEKRIHMVTYERDEVAIQKIYDKVIACNEWIKTNLL